MSRYENYEIKNNVFGTLSAPISSLATTIQLWDWQWARFSVNMLATLENIENWKVMKREIVLITAINWDVLTVERKYAPCPVNDDANTQWKVSYAFSTDDTISAYIDKEHFDEIDKSINDIYDNWVNKLRTEVVSWLQIKVNAWPVLVWSWYYDFAWWTLTLTDNATNYIEIDQDWLLTANTTGWNDKSTKISKVTTSWWEVISIEDWRLWTVWGEISWVNIHDLTEKTVLSWNDEFVLADSNNIYNNKKVKLSDLFDIWSLCIWDWSDWDCVITEDTRLCAKDWYFNNLTICSWVILSFCWDWMPILHIKNSLCNEWCIHTWSPDCIPDRYKYHLIWWSVHQIWNVASPYTFSWWGACCGSAWGWRNENWCDYGSYTWWITCCWNWWGWAWARWNWGNATEYNWWAGWSWWGWWWFWICNWGDWWAVPCWAYDWYNWDWWDWYYWNWWNWWSWPIWVYSCFVSWWNGWRSYWWNWWNWGNWSKRNSNSWWYNCWTWWKWWDSFYGNWWNGWNWGYSYCGSGAGWWNGWNWVWWHYWLVIYATCVYNNCIMWCWWNGWNWGWPWNLYSWSNSNAWCWGNGWNGANIMIFYRECFTQWTIDVHWWSWGCSWWCGGCDWCPWNDWCLILWQF